MAHAAHRFAMFLLCAAPAAVWGSTQELRVALRAESAVSGAFFSLGEIAVVEADDALRARDLAQLRIGKSPRAGRTLVVQRTEVERALLGLKPELAGRVRVIGPERLWVHRGPLETIELSRVRDEAASALKRMLARHYDRFEIEPVGVPAGPLLVPQGRIELKPRAPEAPPLSARASVWTDIFVDGRHYQSVPVQFAVRGYRQVLVARRALAAGTRLGADDLETRHEEVAALHDQPFPAGTDARGLRLQVAMNPKDVLTQRHVAPDAAVGQGDPVVVRLALGAVAVETVAIATQRARTGDVISVRNAESNQIYRVRVTAPGTVETLWR